MIITSDDMFLFQQGMSGSIVNISCKSIHDQNIWFWYDLIPRIAKSVPTDISSSQNVKVAKIWRQAAIARKTLHEFRTYINHKNKNYPNS